MNAHCKLTLLITAVGLFAAFFFSTVILWEMLDNQFDLIDEQLKDISTWVLTVSDTAGPQASKMQTMLQHMPYWIVISETASGQLLYRSKQAQHFDLPHLPLHKGTIRHVQVPDNLGIQQDKEGSTDFRALCMVSHSGKFRVCVAHSLDNMQKEFWKRFRGIAIGLVTFAVVLFGASNIAAKLILRPLAILNRQARAISETHLKYHVPRTKANDEFNALAITLNKVFTRLEHCLPTTKTAHCPCGSRTENAADLILPVMSGHRVKRVEVLQTPWG